MLLPNLAVPFLQPWKSSVMDQAIQWSKLTWKKSEDVGGKKRAFNVCVKRRVAECRAVHWLETIQATSWRPSGMLPHVTSLVKRRPLKKSTNWDRLFSVLAASLYCLSICRRPLHCLFLGRSVETLSCSSLWFTDCIQLSNVQAKWPIKKPCAFTFQHNVFMEAFLFFCFICPVLTCWWTLTLCGADADLNKPNAHTQCKPKYIQI